MNKSDITIVVLLFLLLIGWGFYQRQQAVVAAARNPAAVTNGLQQAAAESSPALPADTALKPDTNAAPAAAKAALAMPVHELPETTAALSNEVMSLTVSSWGGTITRAELSTYRAALDPASGPVVFDFAKQPALGIRGIPELEQSDYCIDTADASSARLTRVLSNGVTLTRAITLKEGSRLEVEDTFSLPGGTAAVLPAHSVCAGPMSIADPKVRQRDSAYLGLDTLAVHGGEGVTHWMKSGFMHKSPVLALFSGKDAATGGIPEEVSLRVDDPMIWLAVKDKFFVQIIGAGEDNAGVDLTAARAKEGRGLIVDNIGGSVLYAERVLAPGTTWTRKLDYYLGPKKYSLLKELGNQQTEIMEFGRWFGWVCKILLPTLNSLYGLVPNYGVAIILLTGIVRILFWPITKKSTESMKKMQAVQPLVTQLRERYKDKPQKLNQEIMALYKEHKVNPMAGCLPMLIQIPVFIALFTVLRSAIELRFAPFLWVRDLSEPEGLFAATWLFQTLPWVHSLNIMPLLMTATTLWQQKITPAAGDPQQQKVMMFMPVFMLFMFYNMASALVLYWTISQLLAVAPMAWQQRRERQKTALTPA